jgi:hypothetical protein
MEGALQPVLARSFCSRMRQSATATRLIGAGREREAELPNWYRVSAALSLLVGYRSVVPSKTLPRGGMPGARRQDAALIAQIFKPATMPFYGGHLRRVSLKSNAALTAQSRRTGSVAPLNEYVRNTDNGHNGLSLSASGSPGIPLGEPFEATRRIRLC